MVRSRQTCRCTDIQIQVSRYVSSAPPSLFSPIERVSVGLPPYICPRFLLLVTAYQIVILFRRLSHTLTRHASYAYLHSPRKARSGRSVYTARFTTRPWRKFVGKYSGRAPTAWKNYGVYGSAVSTTSKCGGSILHLDVLLMRT
jgi:hypothetical protein